MGIVGVDIDRCTILTNESLHILAPQALCCHPIYTPKYIFISTEYLITPDPPIPMEEDKKVSVEYSSVSLGRFMQ